MKKAVLFGYMLLAFEYAESMDRDTRADKLSAEQRLALSEIGPHTNDVQSSSEIDVVQYDEDGSIILDLSRLPYVKLTRAILQSIVNFETFKRAKKIIVSKRVEEIDYGCFWDLINLTQVEFEKGSNLKRIGRQAFDNAGIIELAVPDSVDLLGRNKYLRDIIPDVQPGNLAFQVFLHFFLLAADSADNVPILHLFGHTLH